MIEISDLQEYLSGVAFIDAHILEEDLLQASAQLLSCLLHSQDVYFYDTAEQVRFKPTDFSLDSVRSSLLASTSTLHFKTSGTTGKPRTVSQDIKILLKGVRHSAELDDAVWGFCYSSRHISGVLLLLQAWMTGSPVVDLRNLSRSALTDRLKEYKVTHISAPATFYRMVCPLDCPVDTLVKVSNGGEPFDTTMVDAISASFPNAHIRNVYATTEFGSLLVSNGVSFQIPTRLTGVVKIVDNTIHVHRSRMALSVDFEGNWYDTQDQITWIDQHTFSISGRVSEQVKVLGHLVSLRKVESAINALPDILISRVQSSPHPIFGNLLSAEGVLEAGCETNKKGIKKQLGLELRDYEVPSRIIIVDKIETTYTGKLARS